MKEKNKKRINLIFGKNSDIKNKNNNKNKNNKKKKILFNAKLKLLQSNLMLFNNVLQWNCAV